MYDSDPKKTNTQKLAETLKRCGLASSVTQAHQMAGDITSTERKVQSFFDQKKQEIKADLVKTVNGGREEFQNTKSNDVVSAQIQSFRQENAKQMVERAKNPQPIKIQIEFETPGSSSNMCSSCQQITQSQMTEPKVEVTMPTQTMTQPITAAPVETLATAASIPLEVYNSRVEEKEDYINQYLKPEEKEQIIVMQTPMVAAEKEEIVVVQKELEAPILVGSPNIQAQSYAQATSAPRTEQKPAVDIHNFFNFAKRGKN